MAYNQYTAEQINSEIARRGLENDHWGQFNLLRQFNADPAAFDAARGLAPGTAAAWSANAQQQLAGPIANTRGLADANPQMAYALAQQRGYTGNQADTLYGQAAGTSAGWAQSQGLTGLGAAPAGGSAGGLQIGGTPTPAAMSQASPSTGAGAPTGAWGQPGAQSGWGQQPAAPSQPQGQYRPPAGGLSMGQDPRIGGPSQWGQQGMPSTGNQSMGGLLQYLWQNPSTMAMGNEMTRQVNNNLQRNILPGIRRNAMVDGVSGGSGQGIAEGLAIGDSMAALAGAQAKLYGDQFNQDRNFGLQNDALDFQVHRGNLQDMRTGQLDQLGFLDQMAKWGQQGIGAATQVQNTPLTRWQQFSDTGARLGGLGSQQSQQLQGNPWLGAIGGYMAGSKAFGG